VTAPARHRSRAATLGFAVLLAAGAACAPRDNGTLLVVSVDTDITVPGQMDGIAIDVLPDNGALSTDTFAIGGRGDLPLVYGIRPKGTPSFGVTVTARGQHGGADVVSRTATASFVPGQAMEFTLFLGSACVATPASCPPVSATLGPYPPTGGADAGADAPAGSDGPGPTDAGIREARDDPGRWMAAPSPDVTAVLNGVWPVAADEVWAVGAQGLTGIAYHFQQSATPQWTPSPFTSTTALYGVWGSAKDDVWAVGVGGTIGHWNGNSWTIMQLPGGAAALPPTLAAVWGAGPNDVWAVGARGTVVHMARGGAMQMQTSGVTVDLEAVWGSAVDEVWAVGGAGTVLRHNPASLTWAAQTQTATQNPLNGVWLAAGNDLWAVGLGVALHYDGATWTKVATPLSVPLGIWGSATDDVWSVGGAMGATASPLIARFDGVEWVAAQSPVMTTLQAVRGLSSTVVWAVGNNGVVLRLQ
jgi:hypothetical protein